jgi:hypothetical protein
MKITRFVQFTFVAVALAFVLPARGDTMAVPSKEKPAFTFDVPASWKPKGDDKDESVEASAPGDHAYVSAWVVKTTEKDALDSFGKDLEATLKDSLKSIDEKSSDQTIEVNGTKILVMKGSGVDKRAGNKVQFRVAMFEAGGDNVGIVYADYDNDAPDGAMKELQGIIASIKVTKK